MFQLIFDDTSQPELMNWMYQRTKNIYQGRYLGIAKNGIISACCAYEKYGDTVFGHIATDAQIPKSFLKVMFDYPFNQLKASKIIALVEKDNEKASKLVEKMGFRLIEQDQIKLYQMTKDECKYLTP